jgi:hypothetical protein
MESDPTSFRVRFSIERDAYLADGSFIHLESFVRGEFGNCAVRLSGVKHWVETAMDRSRMLPTILRKGSVH